MNSKDAFFSHDSNAKGRYSKSDIIKYEDGWWITMFHKKSKTRIKLIGSFKSKQLAENEREILNISG